MSLAVADCKACFRSGIGHWRCHPSWLWPWCCPWVSTWASTSLPLLPQLPSVLSSVRLNPLDPSNDCIVFATSSFYTYCPFHLVAMIVSQMKIVGSAQRFLLQLRRCPLNPYQTLVLIRSTILCLVIDDFSRWNMRVYHGAPGGIWESTMELQVGKSSNTKKDSMTNELNFRIACTSDLEPHQTHFQTLLLIRWDDYSRWSVSLQQSARLETMETWRKNPHHVNFHIACKHNQPRNSILWLFFSFFMKESFVLW